MNKNNNPVIGITIGDYNGIGAEIIIKALIKISLTDKTKFIIIGPSSIINYSNQSLGNKIKIRSIIKIEEIYTDQQQFFQIDNNNKNIKINYGKIDKHAGLVAVKCIQKGVELALNNDIQALVTAPVSKKAFVMAGYNYPGQTEMLAELTKTSKFIMMLMADNFRVGLVTTHCAISEVSKHLFINKIIEKIKIINDCLIQDFCIKKPKIAVTSLNPHAGENGLFGKEEEQCIIPSIKHAKKNNINVNGPFSADTLFTKEINFDAYLAMYHDQGLIPLKMKANGKGVNYTAGLPIIRTSPDHGIAFDIAGKWIANENSMCEAIKISYEVAKNRAKCRTIQ